MPLIVLGIIVVVTAAAIIYTGKWQTGRYARLAQKAKVADDADDHGADSRGPSDQ